MKKISIIKRSNILKITKIVIVMFIFISLLSSSTISIETNPVYVNKIQKNNLKQTNDLISNGLAPRNENVITESPDVKSAPVIGPAPLDCTYMYGYNTYPGPEETFYFPIDDPSDYNTFGETVSGDFLAGGTFGCDAVWYAVQYSNGLLYGIDPYTGDMWTIGGGGTGMNGLAYDAVYNRMYGSSDSNYLYEIDPDTGEQEQIGPFGGGVGYMIGMAFDSLGVLYGWDLVMDYLWTIDTETGEATQVGPLEIDINYAQDGDFCRKTDTLYLTAYTTTGQLYICDKETGTCNLIGSIGSGVQTTASIFINSCCCLEHDVSVKSIDAPQTGRAEPDMDIIITVKNMGNNTETFDAQMEIIKCESGPLIFEEYFDDCVMPDGWETDYWEVVNSSHAGGQPCELRCYKYDQYGEGQYYDNYVHTPPIDCSDAEKVNLRFRWAGDYYYSQYCSLYVKIRRNSTSPWKDVTPWDNPVNEQQEGQLYEIGCYGFGEPIGEEFQVMWQYLGYYYYYNYLYLDDITLEACGGCAEYAELVEGITLAPGEETQVSFPPWTPSEWQNESSENTWEEYPVHAFVILDGDHNPINDEKWILCDLWYPWMHDVEVMSIDSPHDPEGRSLPGQTFPVQATMRNVGQYAECCIPIDVKIGNPFVVGTLFTEYDWPGSTYYPGQSSGWTDEHDFIAYYYGWQRYYNSYAGGDPYEAMLPYYYAYGDYYFYSMAIDTTAYQSLRLRFLTYVNHYSGQGLYTLEAGYSTDHETWYAAWSEEPGSSQGWEVDVPIQGGSDTTYIGFWVKGNPYYFNYWYVDNVELVATGYTEEYYDFACQGPDIEPGEEATFTMEDWTPARLAEMTSGEEDYIVEATIEMAGDKNPGNDIKIEELTLEYWWDAGVDEITSPSGSYGDRLDLGYFYYDNGNPDGVNGLFFGYYQGYLNWLIDDFEIDSTTNIGGVTFNFVWDPGYSSNMEAVNVIIVEDTDYCDPDIGPYYYQVETEWFKEYTTGNTYFSRPEIVCEAEFEPVTLMPGHYFIGLMPDGIIDAYAYWLTATQKNCVHFWYSQYFGYPKWTSGSNLGYNYDLSWKVYSPYTMIFTLYIKPGTEDIESVVKNYGTFPYENLISYAQIREFITDPEHGTEVWTGEVGNIDLTPLGGSKYLDFGSYTFTNEGRYCLYTQIPAEPDDIEKNNQFNLRIGVDDTNPFCDYPPILDPPTPDGLNGWYVDDVIVTLNATDPWSNDVCSGVKEIRYTINSGTEQVIAGNRGSFVITQDGEDILVEYWAVDRVGNVESTKNSFTVSIDQTEPEVSLSYEVLGFGWSPIEGWEFQFTAVASDDMSGMNRVEFYLNNEFQYTVSGSGPEYIWTLFYYPLPGTAIFRATAFDEAGLFDSDEVINPEVSSTKQFINKQTPTNEYNTLKITNLK